MKDVLYEFLENHLYKHILCLCVAYAGLLAAMFIDLVCGVKKARIRGEATKSVGLRKTSTKAAKYLTPMLCLTIMDVISCFIIPVPAFSMLWAAYCIYCEYKSVREKAWEKADVAAAREVMEIAIKNKDDLAKMITEIVFNQNKDNENK